MLNIVDHLLQFHHGERNAQFLQDLHNQDGELRSNALRLSDSHDGEIQPFQQQRMDARLDDMDIRGGRSLLSHGAIHLHGSQSRHAAWRSPVNRICKR